MWEELQIAPTRDVKAIRRAYAGRLRGIDVDRDPETFLRLRAAYDRALAIATGPPPNADNVKHPARETLSDTTAERMSQPSSTASQDAELTKSNPEQQERLSLQAEINAALQASDPERALRSLDKAFARGVVQIGERDHALQFLMGTIVRDRQISPERYLAILHEVGWDIVPTSREVVLPLRQAAVARADAERWYAQLRQTAGRRYWYWDRPAKGPARLEWRVRAQEASAASLLLGEYHFGFINPAGLKRVLGAYRHYSSWIAPRFEAKNISRAEAVLKRERWTGPLRKVLTTVLLAAAIIAVMGVAEATGYLGALIGLLFMVHFGVLAYKRLTARF